MENTEEEARDNIIQDGFGKVIIFCCDGVTREFVPISRHSIGYTCSICKKKLDWQPGFLFFYEHTCK